MGRRTISGVNDDPTCIEPVRELLEDEGYATTAYREGPTAAAFLQATRPDLLMLDMRLEQPEGDWAVLEELRADPRTRNLPVIVCSARRPFLHHRAAELQAYRCAVLKKPFRITELYVLVDTMLAPHMQRSSMGVPRERGSGTHTPNRGCRRCAPATDTK